MECSTAYDGVSAWGTAAQASWWIAVEQPGPWGREALTQSHLNPELGTALEAAAADAGGRILLIRGPGQHADTHELRSRRVYIAGGLAGAPWLVTGQVDDPSVLTDLPFHELAGSTPPEADWLTASDPVLLVCTNAKRDRCCALRGRPIAQTLAEEGYHVWECSHTGGHRFAPTGVLLPWGQVLARFTPSLGRAVLDAAASGQFAIGTLNERHDRGISHVPPPAQAALSWVRANSGEADPSALAIVGGDTGIITVQHADGRVWDLLVEQTPGAALPDSCGKPAKPSATWTVRPQRQP